MSTENKLTFAVLDIETTGLVRGRDFKTVAITELCIHGFAAESIRNERTTPRINHRLTLLLNPQMTIEPRASEITALTNSMLEEESSFDTNAANILIDFLKHLKQPVCLVAHNGNKFDYPIIKQSLRNVGMELPSDIMCIDSMLAIRQIDNNTHGSYSLENIYNRCFASSAVVTHQAEADVIMLEKIMFHYGSRFVEYARVNEIPFTDILL